MLPLYLFVIRTCSPGPVGFPLLRRPPTLQKQYQSLSKLVHRSLDRGEASTAQYRLAGDLASRWIVWKRRGRHPMWSPQISLGAALLWPTPRKELAKPAHPRDHAVEC